MAPLATTPPKSRGPLRTADWSVSTEAGAQHANNDRCSGGNGLYAVADGVGPSGEAGTAAEVALLVMRSMWDGLMPSADALHTACTTADAVVRGMGEHNDTSSFLTTLTAVAVVGRTAHVVHVGDSAAFVLRHDPTTDLRKVERLTLDHSMHTSGHPERVSRLLGQGREPAAVDVAQVELEAGDRLLLATDGVVSHVLDDTIAEVGALVADVDLATRSLVQAARSLGSTDDRTAMIVDLSDDYLNDDSPAGLASLPDEDLPQ